MRGQPDADAYFLLDSVTIRNGNAYPPVVTPATVGFTVGGGIVADGLPTNTYVWLTNVTCAQNNAVRGGGIHAMDLFEFHALRCTLDMNTADFGAGLYSLANGDVTVVNGVIRDNVATADGGGVFIAHSGGGNVSQVEQDGTVLSEPQSFFHNCLVVGNAAQRGGGFHLGFDPGPFFGIGMASLVNCTLVQNDASVAGWAIFGAGLPSQPSYVVRNSILWDNGNSNMALSTAGPGFLGYSDLQGPLPTNGPACFSSPPLFVSATNLRLQPGSPCLGAGSLLAIPNDWLDLNGNGVTFGEPLPLDLDLRPRIDTATGLVDLGAFER
jgi:hypothetical protein